jgi:hypothetical protein
MPKIFPHTRDRLLAAFMYLLAPALCPARWLAEGYPRAAEHRNNALAAAFLLALLCLLFAASVAVISYLMVHYRDTYQAWKLEPYTLDILWKTLLAWLVVYVFALGHALWRPDYPVPLLSWLGQRRWVRGAGAGFLAVALSLGLLTAGIAAHAATITLSDNRSSKVFFVYEDNQRFPPLLFQLGVYRIALAARERYGAIETQVLPISKANLLRAFREGDFVVVGSHGTEHGLITREGYFTPEEIDTAQVGTGLQYVYLTGCDSGAEAERWREKLRPANVVTHDRLTAVAEHVWWMWVEAPGILRGLPR